MVASALGRDRIAIEEADPRHTAARYCLGEYYSELGRRFKKGFDVSLSRDPEAADMVRPRGVFLLAMSDGMPIGRVGLRTGGEVAEIKRLWTCQTARGFGIAKRLMHAVETVARELLVKTLRLDTNSALPEALKLYRRQAGSRSTDSTTTLSGSFFREASLTPERLPRHNFPVLAYVFTASRTIVNAADSRFGCTHYLSSGQVTSQHPTTQPSCPRNGSLDHRDDGSGHRPLRRLRPGQSTAWQRAAQLGSSKRAGAIEIPAGP